MLSDVSGLLLAPPLVSSIAFVVLGKSCNVKESTFYHYRPQRSCEGYVFTPVCDSVDGGSVCLSACWYIHPLEADTPRGRHPPGTRHFPWKQTPSWGQTPTGSRHPLWKQTPPGSRHHPWEQTPPWDQTPPDTRPPWKQTPQGAGNSPPGGRQTPAPPPLGDGHCCGWYASYWNAFLFNF